jgi:hypothetical protein
MKSHANAHLRWNRSTSDKPYKCTFHGCDKSFTAKSSLQNHFRTHLYPESSSIINTVQNHLSASIPKIEAVVVDSEHSPFACYSCIHPNCNTYFQNESELRAHLMAFNPGMAAENQFLKDSLYLVLTAIKNAGIEKVFFFCFISLKNRNQEITFFFCKM